MDAKGAWVRANFTISGETVTLQLPSAAAAAAASAGGTAVRYGWEQWARKMMTLLELIGRAFCRANLQVLHVPTLQSVPCTTAKARPGPGRTGHSPRRCPVRPALRLRRSAGTGRRHARCSEPIAAAYEWQ